MCERLGDIPDVFLDKNEILFPVHPDVVHTLDVSLRRKLAFQKVLPILAMPTASPRTALIEYRGWAGFLKLDYPFVLGRFPRPLAGPKLRHGIFVSRLLTNAAAELQGVNHFPEFACAEIQGAKDQRVGVLFRELLPTGPRYDSLYCVASLFGHDSLAIEDSTPLVLGLAKQHGGVEWIATRVLRPLLVSFWKLVIEYGLWPEPHAQNILLGVNTDGTTGVVWRDCQGVWVDRELAPVLAGDEEYHIMPRGSADAPRRRSFLYDWMLGTYVLQPLIETSIAEYPDARNFLLETVREYTRGVLEVSGRGDLLPREKSFRMSLAAPGDQRLPLEESPSTLFR